MLNVNNNNKTIDYLGIVPRTP